MTVDFRSVRVNFAPIKGREQSEAGTAVFANPVINADVAIKGFSIGFTDEDRHIWGEKVEAIVEKIDRNTVYVRVNNLYRDSSGNVDDRYDGYVDVLADI